MDERFPIGAFTLATGISTEELRYRDGGWRGPHHAAPIRVARERGLARGAP